MLYDGLKWASKENFMSGRFFKVISAAVLSIGLVGQANAVLIVGDTLQDSAGVDWTYVGLFDLIDGPVWNDANNDGNAGDNARPLNGIQAAAILFGPLGVNEKYAISTTVSLVEHEAFYDGFGGIAGARREESFIADANGDGFYNSGDFSAFIYDNTARTKDVLIQQGLYEARINYVFKSVEVPEPSTLAIFALALCALGARKFKR
jgi:hypothetical protein